VGGLAGAPGRGRGRERARARDTAGRGLVESRKSIDAQGVVRGGGVGWSGGRHCVQVWQSGARGLLDEGGFKIDAGQSGWAVRVERQKENTVLENTVLTIRQHCLALGDGLRVKSEAGERARARASERESVRERERVSERERERESERERGRAGARARARAGERERERERARERCLSYRGRGGLLEFN
jgi:hypothetical protein